MTTIIDLMLHQRTSPKFFSEICVQFDTNLLLLQIGWVLLKGINQYDLVLANNVALMASAKLKSNNLFYCVIGMEKLLHLH